MLVDAGGPKMGTLKEGSRDPSSSSLLARPVGEITVFASESSHSMSRHEPAGPEWLSSSEGSRENLLASGVSSSRDSAHRDLLTLPGNGTGTLGFGRSPSVTPRTPRGFSRGASQLPPQTHQQKDSDERKQPRSLSFSLSAAAGTPMGDWVLPASEQGEEPEIVPLNHVENHAGGGRLVLLHGSAGVFRYPSARPCVALSVRHTGVSAAIWDDASPATLLASYCPATMLTCYYPDGFCRLTSSVSGYIFFDRDGAETHCEWDPSRTLALQLGPDVRVRSVGRASLELVLSYRALPVRIVLTAVPPLLPDPPAPSMPQPLAQPLHTRTTLSRATHPRSSPSLGSSSSSATPTAVNVATTSTVDTAVGVSGAGDASLVFDPGTDTLSLPVDDPLLDRLRARTLSLLDLLREAAASLSKPAPTHAPLSQRRNTCFSSPASAATIRPDRAVRSAPPRGLSLSSPTPTLYGQPQPRIREGPNVVCPTRIAMSTGPGRMRTCMCDARRVPTLSSFAAARTFVTRCNEQCPDQFTLVYVIPSGDAALDPVLLSVYAQQHACRAQPCAHARGDPLRIVRLAVNETGSGGGAGVSSALLHSRGRLLIYYRQRLVFADARLDGRGCTQADLANQLARTRRDAKQGLALPVQYGLGPLTEAAS